MGEGGRGSDDAAWRRALEALLDLGGHVLAKGFAQPVPEYKDIPRQLRRFDVISDTDSARMVILAGYRNRIDL